MFDLNLSRRRLRLSRRDRGAVLEEAQSAMAQRCLDNGVRPSHLDSHQHVHNIWPIGEIVARFAARQGVPVRLARNLGQNLSLPKRVFKELLNRRLTHLAGATANYVCTPVDLRNAAPPTDGLLEIVAHPNQLGADFGDAYLDQGESLSAIAWTSVCRGCNESLTTGWASLWLRASRGAHSGIKTTLVWSRCGSAMCFSIGN